MRVADDAAAAAKCHHRCVDQFGELENFLARFDGAAADEDHRALAAGDQLGGVLYALAVGLRRGQQSERFERDRIGALGEDVPWHFERDRTGPA